MPVISAPFTRWLLLLLVSVALLAGCARGGPGANVSPRGETRDRITASDEPEGARRARVRLELASAYYSRGQMTTALDEVKQAIIADPTMAAAFNLRGLIYSNLGDKVLAEESFRRALSLNRRDADVMQNYGWYLCQEGRFDEAHALFLQALEVPNYRDSPRTLLAKGVCQARSGQLPAAEVTLQRAYELEPSNPAIGVNLAEVLLKRGNLDRSRFIIRRVNSQADVVNAQTLWLAARIEHKLGNRDTAQSLGDQLRARFPQSPEAGAYERRQFDE
jgi:type IV pilus assembly protein PilF